MTPGDGGNGGNAGFNAAGQHFDAQMDATSAGGAGRSLEATLGSGGDPGILTTQGFVVGSRAIATGGAAGSLNYARAGSGNEGGAGGSTTISLGSPGTANPGATGAAGSIVLANGGDGSAASGASVGGAGGSITFNNVAAAGIDATHSSIVAYANGGAGFDGCPSAAGTNGGAGGSLGVAKSFFAIIAASFGGGRGGNGIGPVAQGGAAGLDGDFAPIGKSGASGTFCSTNFAFMAGPSEVEEFGVGSTGNLGKLVDVAGSSDPWISTGFADPVKPFYYGFQPINYGTSTPIGGLYALSVSPSGTATWTASTPSCVGPISAVSDGSTVYLACSGNGTTILPAIEAFTAGSLTPLATTTLTAYSGYYSLVQIAIDAKNLYALVAAPNSTGGTVLAFSRQTGGALAQIGSSSLPPSQQPNIIFDTGSYIYVVVVQDTGTWPESYWMYQYAIGPTGLTPLSPASFSLPPIPYSTACTPSLCFVGEASDGYSQILQYAIGANGALTPLSPWSVSSSTTSLTLDPPMSHLYGVNGGPGVGQFEVWNVTGGGLTPAFALTPVDADAGLGFISVASPQRPRRR